MAKNKSEGALRLRGARPRHPREGAARVLTSLVAHPKGLVFGDLKQMCGLTDGNLWRHLQVLQEAGLVAIEKGYDHNRPQTIVRVYAGRAAALSRLPRSARTGGARRGERREGRAAAARPPVRKLKPA